MFNALLLSECHIINVQEYEKKRVFGNSESNSKYQEKFKIVIS